LEQTVRPLRLTTHIQVIRVNLMAVNNNIEAEATSWSCNSSLILTRFIFCMESVMLLLSWRMLGVLTNIFLGVCVKKSYSYSFKRIAKLNLGGHTIGLKVKLPS
jgi:hypothetical protein